MTKKKRKLWSLARIYDPRYPDLMLRITELTAGGNLYAVRMKDGKQKMASLKRPLSAFVKDRKEQEAGVRAEALNILERIHRGGSLPTSKKGTPAPDLPGPGEPLTLGKLADLYELHGLHGRGERYRKEQPNKVRRLSDFLGPEREARTLSKSDIDRFVEARKEEGRRKGTIWADVVALKIALNWATEHLGVGGIPLLPSNTLAKVTVDQEKNPRRPVADEGRYEALKAVAPKLPPAFGLALDLAWGTGHRIGAILKLQWEDISFEPTDIAPLGAILWRAEFDKMEHEHETPMNALARRALMEARNQRPGIGAAWIFPSPKEPTRSLDRHLTNRWLRSAEKLAKLPHERGGGWHAFRRGWATSRKYFPLKDVAKAGGWKDTATLQKAYTLTDPETVLAVVNG